MSVYSNPPRYLSNKENSSTPYLGSSSSSTSHSKPRVNGIGAAPRRKQSPTSTKFRHPHRSTSASIQRAKTKSNKKKKPESLALTTPTSFTRTTASVSVSPSAAKSGSGIGSGTGTVPPPPDKLVHIPIHLPRPVFPLVPEYVDPSTQDGIPIHYVLKSLLPELGAYYIVSNLYRPFIDPNSNIAALSLPNPSSKGRMTMGFVIPQLINGQPSEEREKLAERVMGREPDVCLVITGGGVRRAVPVKEIVFRTQCAFWPNITRPIDEDESRELETIEEQEEDSASDTTLTPNVSPTEINPTSPSTPSISHLPIIHLPLPSPAQFNIILHHLHYPNSQLIPRLLNLPSTCKTYPAIRNKLDELSTPGLMRLLEQIHGVWKNLCTLGMGRELTWRQMREGWGLVVGIIAERQKVNETRMEVDGEVPK